MAEITRDKFTFDPKFQDLVLACILKEPAFNEYASLIEPKYFTGSLPYITARALFDYQKKKGFFPSPTTLIELVHVQAKKRGEDVPEAIKYATRVGKLHTHDWEYVHERVVGFCKERSMLLAIKTSVDHWKEQTVPEGGWIKHFEDALRVGEDLNDLGYLLQRDARKIVKKVTKTGYGISSGYPLLDKIWFNGWKPGWLVVPLAPPKRYKTAFSINMAVAMAKLGYDVVYYACELSQELAAIRALQCLTGTPESFIYENPKKFCESLPGALSQLKGKFLLKSYPSKSVGIPALETHLQTVIQQTEMQPRAVFIDYAETVSPSVTKQVSEHQQAAAVYTEARAMGTRNNLTIIMPDRCNKESVNLKVPSMTAFSNSFQKAGIVDVGIGLCATDEEYVNNVIRYFIFINRHGKERVHLAGGVDPKLMRMTIEREIDYTPEDSDSPSHGFRPHGRAGSPREKEVPVAEMDEPPDTKKLANRKKESRE